MRNKVWSVTAQPSRGLWAEGLLPDFRTRMQITTPTWATSQRHDGMAWRDQGQGRFAWLDESNLPCQGSVCSDALTVCSIYWVPRVGGKLPHRKKTGNSWSPEMSSHPRSGASDGAFASFMLASIAAVRLPCLYPLGFISQHQRSI